MIVHLNINMGEPPVAVHRNNHPTEDGKQLREIQNLEVVASPLCRLLREDHRIGSTEAANKLVDR